MITAIREVRRARGMTLDDVARACVPPTTAQTIGRLETGTRTVSVGWLNRIAAALGVAAADLVTLPDRVDVPVVARLGGDGAQAPRQAASVAAPRPVPGLVAVTVSAGVGDYRSGDEIWCERLSPDAFAGALNCDVLVPRPAGRFLFGRLIGRDASGGWANGGGAGGAGAGDGETGGGAAGGGGAGGAGTGGIGTGGNRADKSGAGSGDAPGGGKLHLLPPGAGARQLVIADPPWIARAVKLIRTL